MPDLFIDLIAKALRRRRVMSRLWTLCVIAPGRTAPFRYLSDRMKVDFPLGYAVAARRI
jgi:hypothetical protein